MCFAVFYVDFDKELQFYQFDTVIAAPFDLVTPASPTTSYPYRAFRLDKDATDQADQVVAGNSDGMYVIRTRVGAPIASLRKQRAIVTDFTTNADLEAAGDAELERIGLPQQQGELVCWQPGLFSGMTVHITNPTHSIDDDFVISSVSIRPMDLNPENIGDEGGHAEFTIGFADRLLCIPQRDNSKPAIVPPADCTDCTRTVALLPSGMDENLSLAEGRSHMFVYDAPTLAAYNCAVQLTAGPTTTSGADLPIIDHEPVYEALFAGDRAYYVGTVGPFGDNRWSNGSDVWAGAVMDIRRAWAVAAVASPWVVDTHSAPAGYTIEADGTRLHYVTDNVAVAFIAISHASPGDWTSDFTMLVDFVIDQATVTQDIYFQLGDESTSLAPSCLIAAGAGQYLVTVSGTSTGDSADPGTIFDNAGITWRLKWEHTYGGTSRAKVWDTAGAEPGAWLVSRDASGDDAPVTDRFFMVFDTQEGDATEAWLEDLKFNASTYDNFNRTTTSPDIGAPSSLAGGTYQLETRAMTDGSLVTSTALTGYSYDVRATPNGQHLFVGLYDSQDGPLQRYDRSAVQEGGDITITSFYNDLQDFNVDDAYNVYAIKANVLYRYNAAGAEVWNVDLNAVYGYQWPTRTVFSGYVFGTGQTVIVEGSNVKVCGYIGGADWQTGGSYGVVLTLSRADGALISMTAQEPAGGAAAAQTIAMAYMGPCLWLAGAVDADTFEGLSPGGLAGWLMKLPPDEGGTFDAVASSVTIGDE